MFNKNIIYNPHIHIIVIRSYLLHCVKKYDISKYIQYNIEVKNITWDNKEKYWIVKTNLGKWHCLLNYFLFNFNIYHRH